MAFAVAKCGHRRRVIGNGGAQRRAHRIDQVFFLLRARMGGPAMQGADQPQHPARGKGQAIAQPLAAIGGYGGREGDTFVGWHGGAWQRLQESGVDEQVDAQRHQKKAKQRF